LHPNVTLPDGEICVSVFFDANANGVWESDEAPLANATFLLIGGSGPVADHISDGVEEEFCFNAILGENYVETRLPGGMVASTTDEFREGDTHNIRVGAYFPQIGEVPTLFSVPVATMAGFFGLGIYTFSGWMGTLIKMLAIWVHKKGQEEEDIPVLPVALKDSTGFAPKREIPRVH
jgi:hypothetical protein